MLECQRSNGKNPEETVTRFDHVVDVVDNNRMTVLASVGSLWEYLHALETGVYCENQLFLKFLAM